MRSLRDVTGQLPAWSPDGLSADAARQSMEVNGDNRLTPLPREPLWKKFLGKFDEPIIKILLGAALLSMFVELLQHRAAVAGVTLALVAAGIVTLLLMKRSEWVPALMFGSALVTFFVGLIVAPDHLLIEGLAVMIAVILATGVAFASEFKSDREFESLNARKDSIHVKVLRDGAVISLGLEEIVVGDVVQLETGDEIPADGRVLKATALLIDQSLMTGESEPVKKKPVPDGDAGDGPEQPDCLYRGTQVVDGLGLMAVMEVGDRTYLGQIARRLSDVAEEEDDTPAETAENRIKRKLTISKDLTPLQLKLKKLADLISLVGYIAAGLIFAALLIRGLIVGEVRLETNPESLIASGKALLKYIVYMVIIIVVAVPEGLPMSVTVSLALAMQKMTRAKSLVRQLVACETIGSATVICSDKTGTLTQNKMRAVRFFWDGASHQRGTESWDKLQPTADGTTPLDWIARIAGVNSTAHLEHKEGKLITVGNSTEGALLHWLHESDLAHEKLRQATPALYQIQFSSERKRMTTITRQGGQMVALCKGAPEWILAQSTHYQTADGAARPWTPAAREAAENWVRDAARMAMRTLAFGYAILAPGTPESEEGLHEQRDSLESDLVFVGLVAIQDPLHDDVKDAIAECRAAGIEVKMITGDNVETARAIAYDVGLVPTADAPIDAEGAVVLTSQRFNVLLTEFQALDRRGDLSPNESQRRDDLRSQLTKLRVMARARPLDKYHLVELLQAQSEVVAVTGDGTNDAPALKKADVGLAMGIAGTEVAKEASKIVLLDDSFATIVKAVQWGRSLYENIQRFVQFQLTINVSALIIAFLGPFFGIKPPFTVLQLLWINVIMDTLASIALCSEPPRPAVMRQPPKRKDESILTPAMLVTIFSTAAFFVVVMMTLLAGMEWGQWFRGTGEASDEFDKLSVRQVSIFFTAYILFQIWNEINSRALTPETSGFTGLRRNPTFLTIAGIILVVQVLIVSVPVIGGVFKVEPLGVLDWLVLVVATSSVLVFAEVARRVRMALDGGRGAG